MFISIPLPFKSVYPIKLEAHINWPNPINYKGLTYYKRKEGINFKTNLPSACYMHDEKAIWLSCDGTINED